MLIHLSILGVILVVSLIWEQYTKWDRLYNPSHKMPLLPWIIIFGYVAFLAGMRSGMNDTSVYVNSFIAQDKGLEAARSIWNSTGKDRGFGTMTVLFKTYISDNYHSWFLTFSAIESICFVRVLRRESYSILDSCCFFFMSTLYYNYFSMMRQWFAVAIIFAGFKWLKEKKWLPFFILCIIAAQFHNSAYFIIPIFFIVQGELWSKKQIFRILSVVIAVVFLNPILDSLSGTSMMTQYDYVIDMMKTNTGSSPIRILINAVPAVLAFMAKEEIHNKKDSGINICVNMSILSTVLAVVATFTNGLYVIRFSTYFTVYNMILFPYLLETDVLKEKRRMLKGGFYIFFFLFYIYQMEHQGAWGYSSNVLGNYY